MKDVLNIAGGFAAGVLAVCALDLARARAKSRWRAYPSGPVADTMLRDRVLARIGELVAHPRSVEVEVSDGIVRVSGQVPAAELDGLLTGLTGLRGVRKVHNALATAPESATATAGALASDPA